MVSSINENHRIEHSRTATSEHIPWGFILAASEDTEKHLLRSGECEVYQSLQCASCDAPCLGLDCC